MKRFALVVVSALSVALCVAAVPSRADGQPPQQNPSTAPGTIFKNKAPVSKEILRVTLPKPKEADLPDGLHLLVLEDHRAPLVYFQLIIDGAGGYYDPTGQPGLAGSTAALMREGTTSKTSEQLSQDLDRLAASVTVGASITSPFASVVGSGLSDNVDTVLAILSDVLLHPSFPEAEIARYKTRTRAHLKAQRSQPGFLAQERLSRAVFGDHPASRISATPASIDALTRDALVAFHDAHYVPDHAVMAISGDITLEQAKAKVSAALGAWKKSEQAAPRTVDPAALAGPSVSLIARPSSVQTTIVVGTQAIERTDPDYDALTVANRVLGGPSQRLFEHLREQKGYTYGAGSGFNATRYRGQWIASTDVRTEVTDPALTDLLADIALMRDTPVPADELANNKRAIVASFARSLENPTAVLNNYIDSYIYKLPANYWDTYPDRIDKVAAADVQRVAQKYWAADRLQIVAVGDATKVKPILQKLGTVQEFDADGRPIGK
jgi:zinc protease